jgi:hypothetical protein
MRPVHLLIIASALLAVVLAAEESGHGKGEGLGEGEKQHSVETGERRTDLLPLVMMSLRQIRTEFAPIKEPVVDDHVQLGLPES